MSRIQPVPRRPPAMGVHSTLWSPHVLVPIVSCDRYPKYCSQREKHTRPPAKVCFTPKEIAMKVMHTPHLVHKASGVVLLYSAENLAPAFSGSRTRPTSVWPAQVRRVSAASLACFDGVKTYTERSALSFFIAIAAPGFVGLLTSTLSNAVVLHRQLHGKSNSTYYYDCRLPSSAMLAPTYQGYKHSAGFCHGHGRAKQAI